MRSYGQRPCPKSALSKHWSPCSFTSYSTGHRILWCLPVKFRIFPFFSISLLILDYTFSYINYAGTASKLVYLLQCLILWSILYVVIFIFPKHCFHPVWHIWCDQAGYWNASSHECTCMCMGFPTHSFSSNLRETDLFVTLIPLVSSHRDEWAQGPADRAWG